MKKLISMLLVGLMVVMMAMPGFAYTYTVGTLYRPYGYIILEHGSHEVSQWTDSYNNGIGISYIDNNTLICTINGETIQMTCADPVNYPNMYCTFYTGTAIPCRAIQITGNGELMYHINRIDLDTKYYCEYIAM